MESIKLPILPLRDPTLVLFPNVSAEVDVGREFSLEAIKAAQENKTQIIVAMQRDEKIDVPTGKDFYSICTVAEIKNLFTLEDGEKQRVIVIGRKRAVLKKVSRMKDSPLYLTGDIQYPKEREFEITEDITNVFNNLYDIVNDRLKTIILRKKVQFKDVKELSLYIDHIAYQLPIDGKIRLELLNEMDPEKRLRRILILVVELTKVKEFGINIDSRQNDDVDIANDELKRLYKLIQDSKMPEDAMKIANQEFRRLRSMPPSMSEFQVISNYIETLSTLPWGKKSEDNLDINKAKKSLDEDHYGLEKPKERILEYLAVRKLSKKKKSDILCFYGPPGTGKTSCGKSIAKAMGREFIRLSLGGVHDEAEIRGHRRTYVGAMVGKIMQQIKKVGVNNPVFMLDEVDKLSKDYRGDPGSALLEVLDPEQNNSFVDNYLNIPFDLSDVLFIATVNELTPIPPALRDRMDIIELNGYSPQDKLKIAQEHLIRKQKGINGLDDKDITISPNAISKIIEEYTSEAGVRSLERQCKTIFRKLAVMVSAEKEIPSVIKSSSLNRFLGPPKVFSEKMVENPEVGLSCGLAWTKNGGTLLFVESVLTIGDGKVKLTGNLGEVIKESATAAYTWIKANAVKLGVDIEKMNTSDVHIHFPAGATPKDGPSAGIAITACILSSLLNKPIRNDIAMTGEITLRGRVLPIGGLIEKSMAADRAGIKKIICPEQNKYDVDEIPEDVKNNLEFTFVSELQQALDILILKNDEDCVNVLNINKKDDLINMGFEG